MKVLVYGAGVLGSQLAQVLVRGGNDVTILARGKRAEELEKDGIVIRHIFQFKTTVDQVRVARTLEVDDQYDLIFVVMKYNDFPSVLPVLADNQSKEYCDCGKQRRCKKHAKLFGGKQQGSKTGRVWIPCECREAGKGPHVIGRWRQRTNGNR